MFGIIALGAAVAAAGIRPAPTFEHSRARPAVVVLARNASPAETTAAQEIAHYLGAVTGVKIAVLSEGDPRPAARRVFVGPTDAAARARIRPSNLGPEQWMVRTVGADLLVVGGRPRGTLYAAYHFIEDIVGVHWWTPYHESVPKRAAVRVGKLNLQGQPAFRYRDIYMLYGSDEGRFAARNRLNRDGDAPIHARYGGSMDYGPPYHVHTAYSYFPPQEYFAHHPEWYSLIGGKRTSENAQLCWTNPGLREAFRIKLLATIRKAWSDARAAGTEPPLVFSVSQNDCAGACQCERCQALARSEGSEVGPLLGFVNAMADAVRSERPEVFLDTLAYQYTQTAPKTIRPRDNVIIRLCDTDADMLAPITAPHNQAFLECLRSWARIAKNLRIWDYAVTYGTPGMPVPTVHTFGPDLRCYLAHNVEGVFTEMEHEVLADMRDFKVWTLMKTLEDPSTDIGKLRDTFMSGFYGPAGVWIKRYVRDLEAEAAMRKATSTCWQGHPVRLSYLTPEFVGRAHRIFDRAERAVSHDHELARRVAHARLPLDRATLMLFPKLHAALPGLDRDAIARRALKVRLEEIDRRIAPGRRDAERVAAEGEIQRLTLAPAKTGLPAQFRGRPVGSVADFTAIMMRRWNDVSKIVKDPEAETGLTNRLDLTAAGLEHPERYVLPMPWGLYIPDQKRALEGAQIKADDIPGPGYHWYKLGDFPIAPSTYVWFYWSWIVQVDIENAADPGEPPAMCEVWARVKFEGPRFPHAKPGQTDAICIERVIVARKH